jgi:hypothetical protein
MQSQFRKIWNSFFNRLVEVLRFMKVFILPKNKTVLRVGIVAILLGVFVIGASAYAIDTSSIANFLMYIINWCLLQLATGLGWVAMQLFSILIVISSYNNFVTSPAVTKGWVMMRDVCNLFFVMILLVIAFMIILQVKRYEPTKMLFRVVLVAVLVNFSKLICGLLIDFGQVVMMTFVNGYSASAGGNLVNGLNLTKLLNMSESTGVTQAPTAGEAPVTSIDVFIGMLLAIFILVMTITVTFFILVLLVLRIVQLWILVVLSPLAFTLEAVPLGGLQSEAAKWWQRFGWTVAVGPFMAFFLWLSLLVLSDPGQMVADINVADIEQKGAGGPVSGASGIDNLAQTAIGLALLFGSLMIAQEAGGVVGSMAQSAQKSTMSMAKWTANKMTLGAPEKTGAAFQGYKARRQEFKQMKLAKYKRAGEGVMGAQAKVGDVATRIAKLPFTTAAAGIGYVAGKAGDSKAGTVVKDKYNKAKDVTKKLLNRVGGSKVGGFMKKQWDRTASAMPMGEVMAHRIGQSRQKEKLEEANAFLAARGIDKLDELKEVLMDATQGKDVRKAAALKLSAMGIEGDLDEHGKPIPGGRTADEYAKTANDLMGGDKESRDAFNGNLEKNQLHMRYAMADDKEKQRIRTRINRGELDVGKQNAEAFGDQEFLAAARSALGDKKFASTLEDVSKRSETHGDAIRSAMPDLAETVHSSFSEEIANAGGDANVALSGPKGQIAEVEKAAEVARKAGNVTQAEELEKRAVALKAVNKKQKGFQKSHAKVTGNLDEAFGSRNADGTVNAGTILPGTDNAAALQEYTRSAGKKELLGIDAGKSAGALKLMAQDITKEQITQVATSGDGGSAETVSMLAGAIIAQEGDDTAPPEMQSNMKSKISSIASDNRIMGALNPEDKADIERISTEYAAAKPAVQHTYRKNDTVSYNGKEAVVTGGKTVKGMVQVKDEKSGAVFAIKSEKLEKLEAPPTELPDKAEAPEEVPVPDDAAVAEVLRDGGNEPDDLG